MPMTRRSFAKTFAAGAASALAPGSALAAPPIERVTHHVLANGLEVVAIPDHRVPVATHMIWYRVGSADEQPGKTGLAHFLEHLMFKGTSRFPRDTFSRAVTAVGGMENAFTSYDYTGYFQRVAAPELASMMEFEAERMTGLVLTDAVVDPERDVVLEERRSRVDNHPAMRLSERIATALWGEDHPYGRPVIGWEAEIRGLTREDALAFYRRHYAPNSAILVVAGDVPAEEVFRLAESTYGRTPANAAIAPRVRPPAGAPPGRVRLADARVAQPSLSHIVVAPSYRTARPGEAEAFEVLASVAGSSPNGRFYKALVTDGRLATGAGAFYAGGALGEGRFGFHASPRPGIALERLEAAMRAVGEVLARDGITAAELTRAKTQLVAGSVFAQDSQSSMARMYGAALTCGATVADVQDWANRIRRVEADEVHAAARHAFAPDRGITAELLREEVGR